jgi:valyl-tRNA synthetase
MNVVPSKKAKVIIVTENKALFEGTEIFFEKLASASETLIQSDKSGIGDNAVNAVVEGAEVFIPLDELVDKEKELERLTAEKQKLEAEIKRVEGKLSNESFVAKAPEKVVAEERAKGEKYKAMLEKVLESLENLK